MERIFIIAVGFIYTIYTIILIFVSKSARKKKMLSDQKININPYTKTDSIILKILILLK